MKSPRWFGLETEAGKRTPITPPNRQFNPPIRGKLSIRLMLPLTRKKNNMPLKASNQWFSNGGLAWLGDGSFNSQAVDLVGFPMPVNVWSKFPKTTYCFQLLCVSEPFSTSSCRFTHVGTPQHGADGAFESLGRLC